MNKPFVICFAGAVGSSKSPIAYHLSWKFDLPIFCRDAIRTEVREDLLISDNNAPEVYDEYIKRADQREHQLLSKRTSFILDSSLDRKWESFYQTYHNEQGYEVFLISLDLSKEFLAKLYEVKGYHESLSIIDTYHSDHEKYLSLFGSIANVHITDDSFKKRIEICENALRDFLVTI